jgi:hypothetical protein
LLAFLYNQNFFRVNKIIKKYFTIFLVGIILSVIKLNFIPILNEQFSYLTNNIHIITGFLFMILSIVNSLIKNFFNYFIDLKDLPIFFTKDDVGEGSSNRENIPNKDTRVITDSDYEYESDKSDQKKDHQDDNDDPNEKDVSKFINQNTDMFKSNLNTLTNDELVETMNTIESMIDMHKSNNVPSSKEQIIMLEEKLQSCIEQIESNMQEPENSSINNIESKGKEKENFNNKGKGKEN